MIELARQLALTIESPVWEKVRRPSPWAKASAPAGKLDAPTEQGAVTTDGDRFSKPAAAESV